MTTLIATVPALVIVAGLCVAPFIGLWVFVQGCKVIVKREMIVPPGYRDSGERLTGRNIVLQHGYGACLSGVFLFVASLSILEELFFK